MSNLLFQNDDNGMPAQFFVPSPVPQVTPTSSQPSGPVVTGLPVGSGPPTFAPTLSNMPVFSPMPQVQPRD